MAQPSFSDAYIQVATQLTPNPLPCSLPVGSVVTVRLQLTLQNASSPLSFHLPTSFLRQNPRTDSRFVFRNVSTGDTVANYRLACVLPARGPVINPETDLFTLRPGVTVPVDLKGEVYIVKAASGQEQRFILGSRLSSMVAGEKYVISVVPSIAPIMWCSWGTKEDIIKDRTPVNFTQNPDRPFAFQDDVMSPIDMPAIHMLETTEFLVTE